MNIIVIGKHDQRTLRNEQLQSIGGRPSSLRQAAHAILRSGLIGAMLCLAMFSVRSSSAHDQDTGQTIDANIVVYGGTSGGIAAAIQASRMGQSVVLIEPSDHIGGLTSGGLGATDIGNKAAIGGISREFYQRVKAHYTADESWTHEQREDYRSNRLNPNDDAMWTFEPHVAEAILEEMIAEADVDVYRNERLNRESGITKDGTSIVSIAMESGRTYRAKVFIDATYEGDLLAAAGVSFHIGREANATYDETLNGVQTYYAVHHQFAGPVDPYIVEGDSTSGLLPGIDPTGPGQEGSGDHRVQAYCFRMCTTDIESNRIPWEKPEQYDEQEYELLLRNFEAGADRAPWNPILMPNRKTDTNNNRGFSTDYIGASYDWPSADYETRERIYQDHLTYQQGLMWTLANHPRVPAEIRQEFQTWGNCRDEFRDNNGWSHQLYVREARRMVGQYVMTQHDCQGRNRCDDPVGLAAYTMDSHNVQRYVNDEGNVVNEGDVQVGGFSPYPISYQSLTPKADECSNLLVPVCLSASHIAYGSIRMEPVFMVLGQSAATAASLAIENETIVQQVDYRQLESRLLDDQQVLEWTGPVRTPVRHIDPRSLEGWVVDDRDAEKSSGWLTSRSVGGFVGEYYLHEGDAAKGNCWIRYTIEVEQEGDFDLRLSYTANPNRATNVPVSVSIGDSTESVSINQQLEPPIDDSFISLGEYSLRPGDTIVIELTNEDTDGHVIADAVWLTRIED